MADEGKFWVTWTTTSDIGVVRAWQGRQRGHGAASGSSVTVQPT
jgi:hypothetical protein